MGKDRHAELSGVAVILGGALWAAAASAQVKPLTEKELIAQGARLVPPDTTGADYTLYTIGIGLNNQTGAVNYILDPRSYLAERDGRVYRMVRWADGDRMCSEVWRRDPSMTRQHVCRKFYDLGQVRYMCVENDKACNWVVRIVPGDAAGLLAAERAQEKADAAYAESPAFNAVRWALGSWEGWLSPRSADSFRFLAVRVEGRSVACYWSTKSGQMTPSKGCSVGPETIALTTSAGSEVKLRRAADRLTGSLQGPSGTTWAVDLRRVEAAR